MFITGSCITVNTQETKYPFTEDLLAGLLYIIYCREGNDNPLQCPCLENPRDRRASWAAVYGVA